MLLRHFRSVTDFSKEELKDILLLAKRIKRYPHRFSDSLKGKTLAMIFQKPSLRTRVTFEIGMYQLGGKAIYLSPTDIKIKERESVKDVAQNLSLWVDGIMARVFEHSIIEDLARYSSVPVINGLCDLLHPCQAVADIMTFQEHVGYLEGARLAYVGDGNNVLHSLLLICATLGINISYATPQGYEPDREIVEMAKKISKESGSKIESFHDPKEAVIEANAVYTDVWASMGKESEREKRKEVFKDFQVNKKLMELARKDAFFMHCLPAHRGEEVTDEVIDSPRSIVLDQAENRLHSQKAILVTLMRD